MLLIVMRRVGRPRALAFSSRAAAANLRSGPRGERFGRANGPYGRASDLFGRVSACRGLSGNRRGGCQMPAEVCTYLPRFDLDLESSLEYDLMQRVRTC